MRVQEKNTKNEKNTISNIVRAALFHVIVKSSKCNALYLLNALSFLS